MPPAEVSAPLADSEIDELFRPFDRAGAIALAVSGGADSLALFLCAKRWREANQHVRFVVLSVDHGLRPESSAEADRVVELASAAGFAGRKLVWKGPHPDKGVEAAAREARYRLLLEAAREEACDQLALAHHRDDVAETFLLRLQRGAGVFGLSSMRRELEAGGLTVVRPFLDVGRARLAATVTEAGLKPVEDPMNADLAFARSRVRAALPVLEQVELRSEGLAQSSRRLADASDAIDHYADRLLAAAAEVDDFAVVRLELTSFSDAPAAVRYRALSRIIMAAGGGDLPDRFERVIAVDEALSTGETAARTLGGAMISAAGGTAIFQREIGRTGLPVSQLGEPGTFIWDRRFELSAEEGDITVAALGEEGAVTLGADLRAAAGADRATLLASPGFFREEELIAAPLAGFGPPAGFQCRQVVGDALARAPLFPQFAPKA